MSNTLEQKVKNILVENSEGLISSPDELQNESELALLGFNSFSFIKIVVDMEQEFGIEFDEEYINISTFSTVETLIAYVKSMLQGEED